MENFNILFDEVLEQMGKIKSYEERLDFAKDLYLNIIYQGKASCLIEPRDEIKVGFLLSMHLDDFMEEATYVVCLKNKEFFQHLKELKEEDPQFGDFYDENLSILSKIKEEYEKRKK